MEESIVQIAKQINQLHQKAYDIFFHWLKMFVDGKFRRMNYHIIETEKTYHPPMLL